MANKYNRVIDNRFLQDPCQIDAVEYNPASGGQKSLLVGPRLVPIQIASGYTTTPTAATALPFLGANLAIYNNSGTAGSITVGQSAAVTSQAIGASDANGNVGVACAPNSYTYLSMGNNQWVITSASTLFVYIVEDPTSIRQETGPYMQQNNANTQPIS